MDLITITYPNSTFVSFVFITSISSLVVVDQSLNMINLPASISIGINISNKGCVCTCIGLLSVIFNFYKIYFGFVLITQDPWVHRFILYV